MKYVKISILMSMFLTLSNVGMKGQNVDGIESTSDSLQSRKINVAFNQVEEKDLTGAITVLHPTDYLWKDNTLNITDGMNGRVGGLFSGNNLWGMSGAMVLIDGVPRSFSDITMDEVEQITVLKGAASTVLYGSQAAKGAILITSKKGVAGTRKIDVKVNQSFFEAKAYPQYLGSADYMTLYNEARRNDGMSEQFSEQMINNYRSGNPLIYPDVDYYSKDYLRRFASETHATANFSGGNETARFYSNIGWNNSNTLLNIGEGSNTGYNRFNVRSNVDVKMNEVFSTSVNVSAVLSNSRNAMGDYWGQAASILPYKYTPLIPIDKIEPDDANSLLLAKNSRNIIDGKYLLGGSQEYMKTPFGDLYAGGYNQYVNRLFQFSNTININLNQVVEGLSFQTLFNIDYTTAYIQSLNKTYEVYYPTWGDYLGETILTGLQKFGNYSNSGTQEVTASGNRRNIGFSGQLNYVKSWNGIHNFSSSLLGWVNNVQANAIYQPYTNSNLGLQLSYNYMHKYWVDFSSAVVNSSKLPSGKRVAYSPTLTLSWLMSDENFLKDVKSIDYLKLNTSVGILNTDLDINNYYLYDNVYTKGSNFSWSDGKYTNQASTSQYGANPNLTFAKRKEITAGLQGSFFKNLLTLDANFFWNRMDGMVTQRMSQYPSYYANFVPYSNYNCDQRVGFDLMANLNKTFGEFDFNLGINTTYVTSKVIKRDELYANAYQNRTGKPTDAIFGLVSDGFFMDENDITNHTAQSFGEVKPGDIKYIDQNGDKIIDANDEVQIGRWNAPFYYALNFSASYKNITLFVQGTGNKGGNGIKSNNYYWVDGDKKYSTEVLNRWTEETKNTATYPRLSSQSNTNNNRYSDFWMYSTDRFNLSKVQLTYNFSQNILKDKFVKGLTVYANGANLLTVSKNKDILDLNVGTIPQNRYYEMGFVAKF